METGVSFPWGDRQSVCAGGYICLDRMGGGRRVLVCVESATSRRATKLKSDRGGGDTNARDAGVTGSALDRWVFIYKCETRALRADVRGGGSLNE